MTCRGCLLSCLCSYSMASSSSHRSPWTLSLSKASVERKGKKRSPSSSSSFSGASSESSTVTTPTHTHTHVHTDTRIGRQFYLDVDTTSFESHTGMLLTLKCAWLCICLCLSCIYIYIYIYLSIYEIYIAPLQGNYSEALPAQARAKIKVLRSLYAHASVPPIFREVLL